MQVIMTMHAPTAMSQAKPVASMPDHVTLADYYMHRDQYYPGILTPSLMANAVTMVARANLMLDRAFADGVVLQRNNNASYVSSGWRPPEVNAKTPGAAPNSRHMTCEALDIFDPDGDLDEWCLVNADSALAKIGLWLESPACTKGWCHVQTVPPRSGRRVFYP